LEVLKTNREVFLLVWRLAVEKAPRGGEPRDKENWEEWRLAVRGGYRQTVWSCSPSGS